MRFSAGSQEERKKLKETFNIGALGWDEDHASDFEALELQDCVPGRVVWQSAYDYIIGSVYGEVPSSLSGKVKASERPAVGDWIAFRMGDDAIGTIVHVLPRRSAFSRKAAGKATQEQVVAANIDTVFVVAGLDGEYNPRRLERYVTLVYNSGAVPVIILNKADLCEDIKSIADQAQEVSPGLTVHVVSAENGEGVDELRQHIGEGRTAAFLGSSGVGKSTLVNILLGEERMVTAEVREHDSKGRHTTTHRELVLLDEGGAVIDTPGMREIQVWGDEVGLASAFPEIDELSRSCRFGDCRHDTEPGCAVLDSLEDGSLDKGRYENYAKLRMEFENLESRKAVSARREERRKGKRFAKMVREVNEFNPKRRK